MSSRESHFSKYIGVSFFLHDFIYLAPLNQIICVTTICDYNKCAHFKQVEAYFKLKLELGLLIQLVPFKQKCTFSEKAVLPRIQTYWYAQSIQDLFVL